MSVMNMEKLLARVHTLLNKPEFRVLKNPICAAHVGKKKKGKVEICS